MSRHGTRNAATAVIVTLVGLVSWCADAEQLAGTPDYRSIFPGYVRILCGSLTLEESVRLLQSAAHLEELSSAITLVQEGDFAAALAVLEGLPKPIVGDMRYAYWELLGYIQSRLGDPQAARSSIRQLLKLGDSEQARVDLAAWTFLRELGETPPDRDGLLGVVVQVNTSGHLLAVAGYSDGNARIFTDGGVSILGSKEAFPQNIREAAERLVGVSQETIARVPLLNDCAPPGAGLVRFALLTPGGVHTRVEPIEEVAQSDHPLHRVWTESDKLFGLLFVYYQKVVADRAASGSR